MLNIAGNYVLWTNTGAAFWIPLPLPERAASCTLRRSFSTRTMSRHPLQTLRASPRGVATRVLYRVHAQGAWATPSLDAELTRSTCDARDAALATELVYGSLRALPRLDAAVDQHLHKKRLDPFVRAAMRVAAHQILHLSRVPARAAVHEAVTLVRGERGEPLARLTNAILRKVAQTRPDEPSPPLRLDVPPWVRAAIERGLGARHTERFLDTRPLPPPLGLRAVAAPRVEVAAAIRAARPAAEVALLDGSDAGLTVRGAGDPRSLPGFAEGHFMVQEAGSQLVAAALGAQPGERIADCCAGHGGKTLALLEAVGPKGHVTALDLYEEKLARIPAQLARLGMPRENLRLHPVDLSVGLGGLEPVFDRVLVDAPCSGLGTVHRRPELLLRLTPEDLPRLREQQGALLARAAGLVRPGGCLAYAVCSPTTEEGPDVAHALEAARPDLQRTQHTRIGPWLPGTPDAYQLIQWRRAPGR